MVNDGSPDETWTSTVTTWPSTPSSVALATDASTVTSRGEPERWAESGSAVDPNGAL
jgi:hypothetical protein